MFLRSRALSKYSKTLSSTTNTENNIKTHIKLEYSSIME